MLNKKAVKDALEVALFLAHRGEAMTLTRYRNAAAISNAKREFIESLTNFERDWAEMEDTVSDLAKSQEDLKNALSTQQQLTAQKRELEQQLQQATTKVNDYNSTCQREGERLKKIREELTNQISTLQTQLTTRNSELNSKKISLENQQNSWQRERSNLISQIRGQQELERKLTQVESKIQQIKNKLTEWVKLIDKGGSGEVKNDSQKSKKGWFW